MVGTCSCTCTEGELGYKAGLHSDVILYSHTNYNAVQYVPDRRTVTIDFSCLDQTVYDVMKPYDIQV